MFWSIFKQIPSNKPRVKAVTKDFIEHKLSAAGVSYIVSERTRPRRYLWLIGVIFCIIFMGYMTVNVISEYLNYPKMLIKEDIIQSKLPFPAVTFCSLNPISQRFANMTSLRKHLDLRKLLKDAHPLEPRSKLKETCALEPLCEWSWFLEACQCVPNPCDTEFCMSNNESHCFCSSAICRSPKFSDSCSPIPNIPAAWSKNVCICDATEVYEPVQPPETTNLTEVLSKIENEEVRNVIHLVRNSESYDLSDVDEALMPRMDELYDYGITFDSLVAACSFESRKCQREEFTILYHPKYGKCYMFNYVGINTTEKQPISTDNYGSNSGLRLLLRVTDREVLDLVRREVGARIVIHDPYQLPFVAEFGVNLRPLDMTAVEVSRSTMSRLPAPWGNCVSDETIGRYKEPYSILGCEKQCGLLYMTKKCQCAMRHLLHGTILLENMTQYPLCDFDNDAQKKCAKGVQEDLEKRRVDCQCKPPCNETIYSYSVTSSELNGNYFRTVKAIQTLAVGSDGTLTYINTTDHKSMIGMKVYYNTLQESTQSEKASYSWETLIANIGGNLGFFMGLTLITFLEIVEFLWDFLSTACRPPAENKVYVVSKPSRVFSRTYQQKMESALQINLRRQSI